MTRRFGYMIRVAPLLLLLLFPFVYSQPERTSRPHFEAREHPSVYHGPGRDEPSPTDIEEVRLGYFGPTDPSHSEGGQIWMGAQLAISKANREGGYRGVPFRLVPSWADNPWGSGISQLARSIYTDQLWAIVGSIDGPSTHLVEQLVAKARLPLINPASSDKTVNLANVPWMFSCLPGEHLQAPVLAKAIADSGQSGALTIISGIDHDSRVFTKELKLHLSRRTTPSFHFQIEGTAGEIPALAQQTLESNPGVIAIVAAADSSARLLKEIRRLGFQGKVFGNASMARQLFLEAAGQAANGIVFPQLVDTRDAGSFTREFVALYGREPDFQALQTYDAVLLLVAAVREAGLNRAKIRDALRNLAPWQGVAGIVEWDPLGQNTRAVRLATVIDDRIQTLLESPLPQQ